MKYYSFFTCRTT